MHLNGQSFIIIFKEIFGYFLFFPWPKEPSTVLLYENFKNAKKLTLPVTCLCVGGCRGVYFSRISITYERAFSHSSRYVVQPTHRMHNCLVFATRFQNWVSVNWGRRSSRMRRQRVATDCWICSSAFYPIKWWGQWFDCVGNAFRGFVVWVQSSRVPTVNAYDHTSVEMFALPCHWKIRDL